jgi:hypothetical protein
MYFFFIPCWDLGPEINNFLFILILNLHDKEGRHSGDPFSLVIAMVDSLVVMVVGSSMI